MDVANQLGLNTQYLQNPNQDEKNSSKHSSSSSSNGSSSDAGAAAVAASSSSCSGSSTSSNGAVMFDPVSDIVSSDLVLVMDKFTAADVLREVGQGAGERGRD